MRLTLDTPTDLLAETEAGIIWVSDVVHWRRIVGPLVLAALGVVCAGVAEAFARQGDATIGWLWWVGMIAIFAPAAAALLFARLSRMEAVSILLVVGMALYAVKLLYAPGALWGYDEALHFRTIDNLLATHHLFTPNELLPVSPYYPGLEAVTAAMVQVTGLSAVQAGLVLIGIVRLVAVLGIFLLLERIASPSRFAGSATLLYMSCPAFLYFDSMFSYESLALALSIVTLFVLAAAQLDRGVRRQGLNAIAAVLVLAVVVTHHVTSLILAGVLVAWTLFQVGYTKWSRMKNPILSKTDRASFRRRVYLLDLPGSLWVPVLAVVGVSAWLLNVAEIAISYLGPQLMSGVNDIVHLILTGGSGGRQLFQSSAGHSAPFLERAVGIGSVLLILLLIPPSILYLWERRNSSVLSHFLGIGALAYPAILALRFTRGGWDVGSRATAFVYLPLAFTIAAGIESIVARILGRSRIFAWLVVLVVAIIFAGGIIAGTAPITRLPAPYDPGVAEIPYDTESLAAAAWASDTLGRDNRFAGDSAGGALIGSFGRQQLVTSDSTVSISALFLPPFYDTQQIGVVKAGKIHYVLADRRIAGTEPLKGFIYEKWERDIYDYGSSVPSDTVNKFDDVFEASKIFDSGHMEFYDLSRTTR